MKIVHSIAALRQERRQLQGTVAFVPTMGYLHEGHLELMRLGLQKADHVIASIFVNPTQFGPHEDLARYPRDPEGDAQKCREVGCALLFMPEVREMYPQGARTTVQVHGLTDVLCGPCRPGHFEGVATVVAKLLNIAQPDCAIFGEKDFQQLAVIRQMARDLDMPVDIVPAPLVRDPDGLAMSSRNRYLSPEERARALALSKALQGAWTRYQAGERNGRRLVQEARATLEAMEGLRLDYAQLVHPETLALYDGTPEQAVVEEGQGAVLALAAFVGQTRLIDNLRLDHDLPPELAARGDFA